MKKDVKETYRQRTLEKIRRGGWYVADFRYDEGLRMRDEFISPCLFADYDTGPNPSKKLLLVMVEDGKDKDDPD